MSIWGVLAGLKRLSPRYMYLKLEEHDVKHTKTICRASLPLTRKYSPFFYSQLANVTQASHFVIVPFCLSLPHFMCTCIPPPSSLGWILFI